MEQSPGVPPSARSDTTTLYFWIAQKAATYSSSDLLHFKEQYDMILMFPPNSDVLSVTGRHVTFIIRDDLSCFTASASLTVYLF